MSLTVITHTRFNRPEQLKRNILSVEAALPPGATHKIVPCFDDHGKARFDAALCDEFVAFVDDDDTIDPRSLTLCLDAIKKYNVGAAVTNEVIVDDQLNVLQVCNGVKRYQDMYVIPRVIHHLCVFRSSLIDTSIREMHTKYGGVGMDWFIKTCAATKGGAVHVPINGYFWTQHPGQVTKGEHGDLYARHTGEIAKEFYTRWPRRTGVIPTIEV